MPCVRDYFSYTSIVDRYCLVNFSFIVSGFLVVTTSEMELFQGAHSIVTLRLP